MAETRYIKQAEITIGSKTYPLSRYTFDFLVQFLSSHEPALSRIRLYNIPVSEEAEMSIGTSVLLNAGSGSQAVIFEGIIVGIEGRIENNNKITVIDIKNSTLEYLQPITKSFGAVKANIALSELLKSSKMEIKTVELENNLVLSEELQTIDNIKLYTAINNIAEYCSSKALCNNDELAIKRIDSFGNTNITIVDSDLISPAMAENRTITVSGGEYSNNYKIQTKLNPNYKPDSLISLDTKELSGSFVILEGLHRGGKRKDFVSEIIISLIE